MHLSEQPDLGPYYLSKKKNIISAGYRASNGIFVVGAPGINYI